MIVKGIERFTGHVVDTLEGESIELVHRVALAVVVLAVLQTCFVLILLAAHIVDVGHLGDHVVQVGHVQAHVETEVLGLNDVGVDRELNTAVSHVTQVNQYL